jgi:hypothetical protein
MKSITEVQTRRILCQSLCYAHQNGPAPGGQIIAPLLAEFVKPLLGGALLSPGQIGERPARGTRRFPSLKRWDSLRMRIFGAGVSGRAHENSVPEFRKGEKDNATLPPQNKRRGCGQCGREWFEDLSRPAAGPSN